VPPSRLALYLAAARVDPRLYVLGLGGTRYFEYPWVLGQVERLGRRLRLLDVGSGPSFLPAYLAQQGHLVVTADSDAAQLGVQARFAVRAGSAGRLLPAVVDATRLGVLDGSVDCVTCVSVLEHVPDAGDARAVAELARTLRPGGSLLLTLPYAPAYREARPPYRGGAHQRLYDEAALRRRIIEPSGLDVSSAAYIGTPSPALYRLLLRVDRLRLARLALRWLCLAVPGSLIGFLPPERRATAGAVCLALRRA